jgi:hypothetical protein
MLVLIIVYEAIVNKMRIQKAHFNFEFHIGFFSD